MRSLHVCILFVFAASCGDNSSEDDCLNNGNNDLIKTSSSTGNKSFYNKDFELDVERDMYEVPLGIAVFSFHENSLSYFSFQALNRTGDVLTLEIHSKDKLPVFKFVDLSEKLLENSMPLTACG